VVEVSRVDGDGHGPDLDVVWWTGGLGEQDQGGVPRGFEDEGFHGVLGVCVDRVGFREDEAGMEGLMPFFLNTYLCGVY
jgi:hypothetical protein